MSTKHQPCGKPGCLNCFSSTLNMQPGQALMQNMQAPIHPLQQCLRDNGDMIALQATVAQQAQMIEFLKAESAAKFSAVDMGTAAADGFRDGAASLLPILEMARSYVGIEGSDAELAQLDWAIHAITGKEG
ncbi:hypothetical protein [Pseudomonas sp. dw_612]|uniref:hypothetical protein n=1 Tax=Pseudomonas sp. dw_612 TaxID=2720080 RepID=UPI001BD643A0|nr:hypothetical protein [Pseudomonas sp. dw_612]